MGMVCLLLIVGFVLLIKGADCFVEGSSSVAKLLRVPAVIIGLTVVAFGTSAPELAVSVTAALSHNNGIAVGNVIGSNIFNLLMVLGLSSMVMVLPADRKIMGWDFPFSVVIAVILLAMIAFDRVMGRADGLVLLALFVYFLYSIIRAALEKREEPAEEIQVLSPVKSGLLIVGGLAAIVIGGDLVVDSASSIAAAFGLSQNLIGLTIVAVGTSLPELVTSMVAARKGENGLALGNVIGSNIFNILLILGVSSALSPIQVTIVTSYDLICLILFSGVCWVMGKKEMKYSRFHGAVMVAMYVAYMAYIILRA